MFVVQPEKISVESCPYWYADGKLLMLKVVVDCVWHNLKGLSHEIDLAFDDMYGKSLVRLVGGGCHGGPAL